MESYLLDWANLLLRWLHAVTSWSTVMQTLSCVEAYATP